MIGEDEVLKIAKLAYLEVSDQEAQSYAKDLSKILEHIKNLEKIDVSSIEPMTHVHGQKNVFRADKVEPSLAIKEVLENAPDYSGQYFRVPLVVEHEE